MNYGINALKKIKSDNRFTQEELGKALGISQTNVSNFLNGKTTEIYTIFKEKRELEELKKISFK